MDHICTHLQTGPKPGYFFKNGPSGLGYYLDVPASSALHQQAPAAVSAPSTSNGQAAAADGVQPSISASAGRWAALHAIISADGGIFFSPCFQHPSQAVALPWRRSKQRCLRVPTAPLLWAPRVRPKTCSLIGQREAGVNWGA
eukprot:1158526-Pelagomonas_calceolata.AAC.1